LAGISPFGLSPFVLVVAAGLASLVIFALNSALEAGLTLAWSVAGQRMAYDLSADLFKKMESLSLLFHHKHPVGDSLSRLTGDAYVVYTLAEGVLISPVQHLLTLVLLGAVAWRLDSQLTLLSFAVAPLTAAIALYLGRHLKARSRQSREAHSRLLSFVHQTLVALPVVQVFNAQARNGSRFHSLAEDAITLSQRGALLSGSLGLAGGLTRSIGMAAVLYYGGLRVLNGNLTVGALVVFVAYMRSLQGAVVGLLAVYAKMKSTEASLDRVAEILNANETIREAPKARRLPRPGKGKSRRLSFVQVSFGYEPDRPVIMDITLELLPGEVVALVGPSGAGKSTLACLIPRFYDPWQGQVLLDGVDVRDLQLSSLRADVAWVPQEPLLLPLSVTDNIRYGRPEASLTEVKAAAAAARAHQFIERLPHGYETVIGQRGTTLSGGEKQRLAIARALLKDSPVLVLDEPTSSLDAETEGLLLEALEVLMTGRTTLLIAHRMSTARAASRVVVLRDGRIRETGSGKQLQEAPAGHTLGWRVDSLTGEVKG